jgi:hypothetical protein
MYLNKVCVTTKTKLQLLLAKLLHESLLTSTFPRASLSRSLRPLRNMKLSTEKQKTSGSLVTCNCTDFRYSTSSSTPSGYFPGLWIPTERSLENPRVKGDLGSMIIGESGCPIWVRVFNAWDLAKVTTLEFSIGNPKLQLVSLRFCIHDNRLVQIRLLLRNSRLI